jgi:hypothetical protein
MAKQEPKLVVFLVCFVMLVFVSGVFAQEAKPQVAGHCEGDIAKFCGDVKPGEGQITRCLEKNKEQLSPECKTHIAQMKEAIKGVHKDCEDDITMFCAGVKPGEGRIWKCLKKHKAKLSSKCQEAITKKK